MPILVNPPAALPLEAPTVLLPVADNATISIDIDTSVANGIANANAATNPPPAPSIVPAPAVGVLRETPVLVARGAAIAPVIRRVRR